MPIITILAVCTYWFVPPQKKINLGLDLKGGIHLLLQALTDEALTQELYQVAERIAQDLKSKNIPFGSSKKGPGSSVDVAGIDPARDREVRDYLNTTFDREYSICGTVAEGKNNYNLTLQGAVVRRLRETTVSQALETIRKRVDALGVRRNQDLVVHGLSQKSVKARDAEGNAWPAPVPAPRRRAPPAAAPGAGAPARSWAARRW